VLEVFACPRLVEMKLPPYEFELEVEQVDFDEFLMGF
jgi:hypothetical protein